MNVIMNNENKNNHVIEKEELNEKKKLKVI